MRCATCDEEKPLEEFPSWLNPERARAPRCKACHYARNKAGIQRRWGNTRHYHLMQKYGVSEAEVEAMKAIQGGLCPICKTRSAEHVDHDHATGRVRAILCELCNGFLGAFDDDPRLISAAIDYLEKSR